MLEEKNDNLHNADGEQMNASDDTILNNNLPPEENTVENDDTDVVMTPHATEGQLLFVPEDEIAEDTETPAESESGESEDAGEEIGEALIAESENVATEHNESHESQTAVEAIESSNAQDSEEDGDGQEIPMQNYEELSMEELTAELEKMAGNEKVMSTKNHIEEIKKEFYSKYNHLIEEKKEEYSHDNNGDSTGFEYNFPLKGQFDNVYNQYRDRKNTHFKKMQSDLKGNLENRVAIIEELKNLIDSGENIKDALKHVNELRDRWKNAGPIPRDKYNHVWNNFHFHIERFYDHLHLDREARDVDFKHNLEHKQKIIARVEELVNEEDINKAFRELQALHKIW
ncbi:MAG: DUF349 domain-containing protein, partial [Flavobacterium sp.]